MKLKPFTQAQKIVLAGCKADREDKSVDSDEALKFANDRGLPIIETSAKDNLNVNEIFYSIARQLILRREVPDKKRSQKQQWLTLIGGLETQPPLLRLLRELGLQPQNNKAEA